MNYLKLVSESNRSFTDQLRDLVTDDKKARQLFREFKKDNDKIVDYIDYVLSKYFRQIDHLMKRFNVDYDQMIEMIERVN